MNKHLVIPGSAVKVRPESERPIEPSSKSRTTLESVVLVKHCQR